MTQYYKANYYTNSNMSLTLPATRSNSASYFENQQQTTHTQHATSTTQTITHGIPQGSTLSTTFFLLYINDIIKTAPENRSRLMCTRSPTTQH
jgi:hypothetical protein